MPIEIGVLFSFGYFRAMIVQFGCNKIKFPTRAIYIFQIAFVQVSLFG